MTLIGEGFKRTTVMSVRDWNILASKRFNEVLEEFGRGERDLIPYRPFYQMSLPNGEARQRGFVITKKDWHWFVLTRKELEKKLVEFRQQFGG